MTALAIDRTRRSPNHGERVGGRAPDSIVLHYTGMHSGEAAIAWLCDPASEVSSHYVVTETGRILQLVDEDRRAWHAGRSFWQGECDMNSASIGIEIVNGGHDFGLPAFPSAQIEAVASLCADIMRRHRIAARRVLAHSDIAPGRKRDPGERFPWRDLAQNGVGLWPDALDLMGGTARSARDVGLLLTRLGFDAGSSDETDETPRSALEAFQRRYRPDRVDGRPDAETLALLEAVCRLHEQPL